MIRSISAVSVSPRPAATSPSCRVLSSICTVWTEATSPRTISDCSQVEAAMF
ncbi:hypothetical protein ACU4GA_12995 [Methylobacterium oryzae CBMB20]